jgi:DNA helicase-2/ATP-dependent DNA helicase PcrA
MEDEPHKLPGPVLLLAGPGTGKTQDLAKRIKWLVEERNVDPENVTVITFTRPAAREMRERISDPTKEKLYVPPHKQPKMIRTMHSLGHKIITEDGEETQLNGKPQVVWPDSFRNILVGDAAQLSGYAREDGKETADCRQFGDCNPSDERKCKICESYKRILDSCSAIDHDEQILLACRRLEEDKHLLTKYRSYCQHLLVDEYQDINAGQFKLIQLLSEGQREGLFVVGDDDQSIYSWRGGSPKYIRNFKDDFGAKAQIKTLTVSHRCPRHILEGAMCVVAIYDRERRPKERFEYEKGDGEKIKIHSVPSDEKEAKVVKSIVEEAIKQSKDVLILFPYKSFSEDIAKELREARIQYDAQAIIPGEGLPLISELSRWLATNSDSLSFRKCLEAVTRNPDFHIPSKKANKPKALEKKEGALLRISNLWKHVIEKRVNSLWESLKLEKEKDELYSKLFSAFEHLRIHYSQEEPAGLAAEIVKTLVPWKKSQSFLDEVDLWVQTGKTTDDTGQGSKVQLMTWQSAKGLGAHVVCIVGVEENTLPKKEKGKVINIAEESRKFLVSLTRASEEVHVFHARNRSQLKVFRRIYKPGNTPDLEPSVFLSVIPKEHKELKYHRA